MFKKINFILIIGIVLSLTFSVSAKTLPPLKIYIRDSLYHSFKASLPNQLPPESPSSVPGRALEWIPIPGSMLYARLKLEGDKTPADIVVGLEGDIFKDLQSAPLSRSLLEKVKLPLPWPSPNFLPLYYGYLSIFYNEHSVRQPPISLWELINLKGADELIAPDPRTSIVGLGFAGWIIESFPQLTSLENLKSKIKTMPSSWDLSYAMFQKKEAGLTISYTTSLLYHRQKKEDWIKMISSPEGNPLQVFGALKTFKALRDPDADSLLKWLIDEDFQNNIAQNFFMYPVLEKALTLNLLSLPRPEKVIMLHRPRQEVLDQWQKLIS